MDKNYKLTKYACYLTSFSMAVVLTLSPLLFVTFQEIYSISYTLLGLLIVVNFTTQLLIDVIFSLFSDRFNIHKVVRLMPLITFIGMVIYSVMPMLFPEYAYLWIIIGTIIFSVAAGLNEVLTSPVIAAIPSDNPEKEMSILHSAYAWGVVLVVIISSIYLKIFGTENWNFLGLLWSAVPFINYIMFKKASLPEMEDKKTDGVSAKGMGVGLALFAVCIFFGGASECTMSQWSSSFIERTLNLPKLIGDILGVALFSVLLGLGRTLYAKIGKNILNVMLWGMAGSAICYLLVCVSDNAVLALAACVVTGLCSSMLWPGTIICVGEKYPTAGVWVYALMAAGGDMGASVAPQIVGIIADNINMRVGMLAASVFPALGLLTILIIKRYFKTSKEKNNGQI